MEAAEKNALIHRAERALDSIRPFLAADSGDVAIVDLTDDMDLHILMSGSCETCGMKDSTLKGVEGTVLSAVPEIKRIIAL